MTEKDKKMVLVALEELKAFDYVCEINGWEFSEIDDLIQRIEKE